MGPLELLYTLNWKRLVRPIVPNMKLIDLSHSLEDGMKAYPSFPSPKIGAYLTHEDSAPRYQNKASFYIGKIEMVCNTGTCLDSPFHRYEKGKDLNQIPLEKIAGLPGIVIDGSSANRAIDIDTEEDLRGHAVLVRTGWDVRWGTERYWDKGPYFVR